jgi:hypothetical protein
MRLTRNRQTSLQNYAFQPSATGLNLRFCISLGWAGTFSQSPQAAVASAW